VAAASLEAGQEIFQEPQRRVSHFDDTVIGKDDSAWKTEMTSQLWSSAEKRYLYGQSVVLLIWTDGKTRILLDVRFKVKGSAKTKFDLALETV